MNPPRASALLLLLMLAFGAGGCASESLIRVRPWQRGTLAGYSMNPNRDPLDAAMSAHVTDSRETASGGRAVGGSGCGCN